MNESEFNLWKILEVMARRRKFIISFILGLTILSIVISLILPKWYEAKALMLPPKDEGFKLGWSGSSVDELVSLTSGIQLPVMATATDVYARIFESRLLADRVIRANDLNEYYEMDFGDDLFNRIEEQSDFRVTPEGLLEIKYEAKDAQKASDIVNSFIYEMDVLTRELAADRAKVVREFLEIRKGEVATELDSARNQLQLFQSENRAIDLDRQTQLAIETAVGLKVKLAQSEIDLSVKENTLSGNHPEVINLRSEVKEIKAQISRLEFGGADSSYFNLPVANVPILKIKYAELSSRVKVSETLFQILTEQYEQARIQEKMNTPTISVIDRASPPKLPVRPQKKLIVIGTFLISLILALFISLLFNYFDLLRVKAPDDYERAKFFMVTIFGWLPGVKKSFK